MEKFRKYIKQVEISDPENKEPLCPEEILSIVGEICELAGNGKEILKISYSYYVNEYEMILMGDEADDDETPDTG